MTHALLIALACSYAVGRPSVELPAPTAAEVAVCAVLERDRETDRTVQLRVDLDLSALARAGLDIPIAASEPDRLVFRGPGRSPHRSEVELRFGPPSAELVARFCDSASATRAGAVYSVETAGPRVSSHPRVSADAPADARVRFVHRHGPLEASGRIAEVTLPLLIASLDRTVEAAVPAASHRAGLFASASQWRALEEPHVAEMCTRHLLFHGDGDVGFLDWPRCGLHFPVEQTTIEVAGIAYGAERVVIAIDDVPAPATDLILDPSGRFRAEVALPAGLSRLRVIAIERRGDHRIHARTLAAIAITRAH